MYINDIEIPETIWHDEIIEDPEMDKDTIEWHKDRKKDKLDAANQYFKNENAFTKFIFEELKYNGKNYVLGMSKCLSQEMQDKIENLIIAYALIK